jgi:serine/threonine protein kinase
MADYIGQQLGNYQLTRLVGDGAFAQVYLGEHIYLGTQAAIKVLDTQLTSDPVEWFRTEARTIARLVHPNIVRVLDFGIEGNTPFLVMEYAPNGTLRQRHAKGAPLPLPTVVSYVKQIAEALQYAHDEKLIHRDVKPENMLLGRRNEVLLSDFGIAMMIKTFKDENVEDVAGTLVYMAPEQLQGHPLKASDQYALGIITYEWITGERPFNGSPTEVLSQHLIAPPPPLRKKVPTIAPAVEQVVMKVLEKAPEKRFRSVREFALALEQASRYQTPTPSSQYEAFAPGQGSIEGGTSQAVAAPSFFEEPVPAVVKNTTPPPPSILPPLRPARPVEPIGTVLCNYRGHLQGVRSLSWSPDGTRIVSASHEKTVHIWNAMTGSTINIYNDQSNVIDLVAWSPDGTRIAMVGADAHIQVWDFVTNRLIASYRGHLGNTVNAIAWSPGQFFLASAASDGRVHVWDAMTGRLITIYQGHAGSVNMLAWFPDEASPAPGRDYRIVSGGDDRSVQIWDAFTGTNITRHQGYPARVTSVDWSPRVYSSLSLGSSFSASILNSSRVGCGRDDGMVQMWDTATNREVLSYRYAAPISVVAWSPNGARFAYGGKDAKAEVWDTRTNLRLFTFSHATPTQVLAWSPSGKHIASGGSDGTIQVWVAP